MAEQKTEEEVTELFREDFAGPTCLYVWLLYKRPILPLIASDPSDIDINLQIECEVIVYKIKKQQLTTSTTSTALITNRKRPTTVANSQVLKILKQTKFPLKPGPECYFADDISPIELFAISHDQSDKSNITSLQSYDIVLHFHIYCTNSKLWPPVNSSIEYSRVLNCTTPLNLINNLVDCSERDQVLYSQIDIVHSGKLISDGNYENHVLIANNNKSSFSKWKLRFSVYWDYKTNLRLKKLEPVIKCNNNDTIIRKNEQLPSMKFIFHASDCELHQTVNGFQCPWCTILTFNDFISLMQHLYTTHIHFKYKVKIIMVTANNKHTIFDYFTMNKKLIPKPFAYIKEKVTETPSILKLSKKTFYHCYSFMPYRKNTNKLELEDKICRHWLTQQNNEELDEKINVNDGTKLLMKLWNEFIDPQMSSFYKGHSDENLPNLIREFSTSYKKRIVEQDLIFDFTNHLYKLNEHNLIDDNCVVDCLNLVN
ncbi:23440_t:CDS:2 [Entrophospora sp. SA101]|nr:23440_t:CDS:2 [Entrophospora sp. SA101]